MNPALLTGRELVEELARLGVGSWTPDAVRQWLRQGCPCAEPADQGKPHRYRVADVLTWRRQQAQAERAKGFTRADNSDLVARIDAALSGSAPASLNAPAPVQTPIFGALDCAAPGAGAAPAVAPAPVSPAKGAITGEEAEELPTVEILLEVIKGRDARAWKAAEEALVIRQKRLVELRRLIVAEEFERAVEAMLQLLISGLNQLAPRVADAIPDQSNRVQRLAAVQKLVDETRDSLARAPIQDA